jgi:hypothetical protein
MPVDFKDIDDKTTAYILSTQSCFEDLKQVAAQLAGQLVLAAAGSRNATPDHPMLLSARRVYTNAVDGLRSAEVTARARLHHSHLSMAAAKLDRALHAAGGNKDPLALLESGYADLRAAARALPGFEMMSFERGCCAITK